MVKPVGRGKRVAVKVLIGAGLLCGLGFLFWRSVRESVATPYRISATAMRDWTLAIDENGANPGDPILILQPPGELTRDLFGQLFKRVMESMNAPSTPAVPLILRREFDRAFAGQVSPSALLAAARSAGLDRAGAFQPRCLAHRRVSEPTGTQQLYFVLFDAPAFTDLRQRLATMAAPGGGFDPGALSPVLFIAVSESVFARWLPLKADAQTDCIAPISVGGPSSPP